MQIKLGDKVRVLQHRNYFNARIPHDECLVGTIITVSEWYDINDGGEAGDWRAFTSTDVPMTWFRTDDVELVSEGPVRTETVTERRIVPGVYGRIRVIEVTDTAMGKLVGLGFVESEYLSAEELDDLAMIASQLAEALRDVD